MLEVKDKERILKAAREKQLATSKRNPIKLSSDFSAETLQATRKWQDIVKVLKAKPPTKNTPPSNVIIQN